MIKVSAKLWDSWSVHWCSELRCLIYCDQICMHCHGRRCLSSPPRLLWLVACSFFYLWEKGHIESQPHVFNSPRYSRFLSPQTSDPLLSDILVICGNCTLCGRLFHTFFHFIIPAATRR